MKQEVIDRVRRYILDTFLPGEDERALAPDTELIASGILDSLATLDLVAFLESTYGIELEAHEVDPSNLGTLDRIGSLVAARLARSA